MLKGFWNRYKGTKLCFKLKEFCWELVYAWQRAWQGYDYTDVFNFNSNFIERTIAILKDYKENNISLFSDGEKILTEDETDAVIDEMIYLFENSDGDALSEYLYDGLDACDFDKVDMDAVFAEHKKAKQNQNKAFELFCKYFDNLWY